MIFDIFAFEIHDLLALGIAEFMIGSEESSDRNYIGWWEVKNDKIMIFNWVQLE